MAAAASGGDTQTPAPEEPTWEEPALEEPAPAPAPVPEEPTWEEPANQGYEKTAEEANWLCQEFVRAASEHQAAIQSYVDVEYNAKIESLEEDLENNNASCEAQIAQLYRNTGDIANNRTLLAALQVQEQNIRQQYGRYNNEIEGQITQLQQMRDAYIQEYDTGSYVFERMSENTGLSIEELNILMFDIYEEEVTSYLSSLE